MGNDRPICPKCKSAAGILLDTSGNLLSCPACNMESAKAEALAAAARKNEAADRGLKLADFGLKAIAALGGGIAYFYDKLSSIEHKPTLVEKPLDDKGIILHFAGHGSACQSDGLLTMHEVTDSAKDSATLLADLQGFLKSESTEPPH